jgi:uncharacterized protein YdhG (YjbR/CyaY superfamily)
MGRPIPKTFNDYAEHFPKDVQALLRKIRLTIKKAAPKAENGMLVWFAAHTSHIGFYPRASGIATFKTELSAYKLAKGSVQFPFDEPLPLALITRIVKFRVKENMGRKTQCDY